MAKVQVPHGTELIPIWDLVHLTINFGVLRHFNVLTTSRPIVKPEIDLKKTIPHIYLCCLLNENTLLVGPSFLQWNGE